MGMRHDGPVYCVAWEPAGEYLLTGGQDKLVSLWKPSSGQLITQYKVHGWPVLDISVSPDGRSFVSGGGDRAAILWDVPTGRLIRRLPGHISQINTVSCQPCNTDLILTGSQDRTVRIWDRRTFSRFPVQVLDDALDSIESVAVQSPLIATGSVDGRARVYDVRKGQLLEDLIDTKAAITRVRVGKDTAYYASSVSDGTCALIDLGGADRDVLCRFTGNFNSERFRMTGMLFDKNEECVVVGSEDGHLQSFDLLSGERISNLPIHSSPILCIDSAHSSARTACGHLDGVVSVFNKC